jgi:hypothetical protein
MSLPFPAITEADRPDYVHPFALQLRELIPSHATVTDGPDAKGRFTIRSGSARTAEEFRTVAVYVGERAGPVEAARLVQGTLERYWSLVGCYEFLASYVEQLVSWAAEVPEQYHTMVQQLAQGATHAIGRLSDPELPNRQHLRWLLSEALLRLEMLPFVCRAYPEGVKAWYDVTRRWLEDWPVMIRRFAETSPHRAAYLRIAAANAFARLQANALARPLLWPKGEEPDPTRPPVVAYDSGTVWQLCVEWRTVESRLARYEEGDKIRWQTLMEGVRTEF